MEIVSRLLNDEKQEIYTFSAAGKIHFCYSVSRLRSLLQIHIFQLRPPTSTSRVSHQPSSRLKDIPLVVYSWPVPLSVLPSGGWSLKRRWRREERDGVNRTCPRCRCTVCLSSGRVCRRERCFWTWRATRCLRSSVSHCALMLACSVSQQTKLLPCLVAYFTGSCLPEV